MIKYLDRTCPMCGGYLGIVIAGRSDSDVHPIHGICNSPRNLQQLRIPNRPGADPLKQHLKRRTLLNEIFEDLGKNAGPMRLSETMDATPADLIQVAKKVGFEGIVAKRRSSFYESGKRTGAWLKYRINKAQEFVIGGYVPDNP